MHPFVLPEPINCPAFCTLVFNRPPAIIIDKTAPTLFFRRPISLERSTLELSPPDLSSFVVVQARTPCTFVHSGVVENGDGQPVHVITEVDDERLFQLIDQRLRLL